MADRFSHGWNPGEPRRKGKRAGSLWFTSGIDGEVTFSQEYDALDYVAKVDLIEDFIGLLERERDVLRWSDDKDRRRRLKNRG